MFEPTEYHHLPTVLSDLDELLREVRDHRLRIEDAYGDAVGDIDSDLHIAADKIAARYGDV